MAVTVTAGQRHESTQFEAVMGRVRVPRAKGRPRCRPRRLAGDKGYPGLFTLRRATLGFAAHGTARRGGGGRGAPSPSPADRLAVSSMSSGSEAEADYPGRARAGGRLTARLTATN